MAEPKATIAYDTLREPALRQPAMVQPDEIKYRAATTHDSQSGSMSRIGPTTTDCVSTDCVTHLRGRATSPASPDAESVDAKSPDSESPDAKSPDAEKNDDERKTLVSIMRNNPFDKETDPAAIIQGWVESANRHLATRNDIKFTKEGHLRITNKEISGESLYTLSIALKLTALPKAATIGFDERCIILQRIWSVSIVRAAIIVLWVLARQSKYSDGVEFLWTSILEQCWSLLLTHYPRPLGGFVLQGLWTGDLQIFTQLPCDAKTWLDLRKLVVQQNVTSVLDVGSGNGFFSTFFKLYLDGKGIQLPYHAWEPYPVKESSTKYQFWTPNKSKGKTLSNENEKYADEVMIKYCNKNTLLYMGWPYCEMASHFLRLYTGSNVLFAGQLGDGSVTADKEFHKLLDRDWTCVNHWELFSSPSPTSTLYWFTRNKESPTVE